MRYSELNKLFRELAETHTDIRHSEQHKVFFDGDTDAIIAGVEQVKAGDVFMICQNDDYMLHDKRSANIELMPKPLVVVAIKSSDTSISYAQEQEMLDKSFNILYHIIRRINERWERYEFKDIRFIDMEEASIKKVDSVALYNSFGWQLSLPIRVAAEPYNPDEIWL